MCVCVRAGAADNAANGTGTEQNQRGSRLSVEKNEGGLLVVRSANIQYMFVPRVPVGVIVVLWSIVP